MMKSHVDQQASRCFSCTSIFNRVLVTGFHTYPEHTPIWATRGALPPRAVLSADFPLLRSLVCDLFPVKDDVRM
jgi:hypothetical protein